MSKLSILTLESREPIQPGEVRYMLGAMDDQGAYGVGQYVIIVEPITPDNLQACSSEEAYGTLAVITDEGRAVVHTVGLGVLVLPAE